MDDACIERKRTALPGGAPGPDLWLAYLLGGPFSGSYRSRDAAVAALAALSASEPRDFDFQVEPGSVPVAGITAATVRNRVRLEVEGRPGILPADLEEQEAMGLARDLLELLGEHPLCELYGLDDEQADALAQLIHEAAQNIY